MTCLPACFALAVALSGDTLPVAAAAAELQPVLHQEGPRRQEAPRLAGGLPTLGAAADTVRRPALVEHSDAYYTRLTLHRWGSYLMLPLFAAQFYTGERLLESGGEAPGWARDAHGPLAAGVATLFTVNTVTGVWNAIESRHERDGRGRRLLHSALMLAADAGFTATGLLAEDAEESSSRRSLHRNVALASMGTAVVGWAVMLPIFGGGH